MIITKPTAKNLPRIKELLLQWAPEVEASQCLTRISEELSGANNSIHCFIVTEENTIVGVGAFSANHEPFAQYGIATFTAIIDILYLDSTTRGKSYGSRLLDFIEAEARHLHFTSILAKSAGTQCPAYDFFGHKGYKQVGLVTGSNVIIVFQKTL